MKLRDAKIIRKLKRSLRGVVSTDPNDFCPNPLYHYTSAAGLFGIITTGTLWGSNYSYLGDPSEISYGRKTAFDLVGRLIKAERDQEFALFLTGLQHRLGDPGEASDIYLASFCGEPDLLGQWRAYGRGTGRFCVGFDSEADCLANVTRFGPAVYDTEKQLQELQFPIAASRRAFFEGSKENPLFTEVVANELLIEILRRVTFFKHPGYVEEGEWRMVHVVSEASLVHLQLVNGIIKPFIDIMGVPNDSAAAASGSATAAPPRLPIIEIVVGPSQIGQLARKSVELLLEKHGYEPDLVRDSAIPFREL